MPVATATGRLPERAYGEPLRLPLVMAFLISSFVDVVEAINFTLIAMMTSFSSSQKQSFIPKRHTGL